MSTKLSARAGNLFSHLAGRSKARVEDDRKAEEAAAGDDDEKEEEAAATESPESGKAGEHDDDGDKDEKAKKKSKAADHDDEEDSEDDDEEEASGSSAGDGASAAVASAVSADRTRISAILGSEEAVGKGDSALHLALTTDMTVDQATTLLATLPDNAAPNALAEAMKGEHNPKTGALEDGGAKGPTLVGNMKDRHEKAAAAEPSSGKGGLADAARARHR